MLEVFTRNSVYKFSFENEVVQGGVLSELPQKERKFEAIWFEDNHLGFRLRKDRVSYKTSPIKKVLLCVGEEKIFLVPHDLPGVKQNIWGIFFKELPDMLKKELQ
jgi:hypothetical protein